jgi:DNA-binding MarR family transcriptional regulator
MDRQTGDTTDAVDEATVKAAAEPAANGPRLGPLGNNIAFHLRMAQDASFRAFKRHTGESDLHPGWYAVLTLIDANPGITPMGLSRASGRDKSSLTPLLRELVSRRYVEQRPVPGDRRSYALALTPSGKERLARLAEHAQAHDLKLDEIVGPGKAELIEMLRRIANTLD